MNKFFKLARHCGLVDGKKGTMIFDFENRKAYHVEKIESDALKMLRQGSSVKDVCNNNSQIQRFINQLLEIGIGTLQDSWAPSEGTYVGQRYELHPEYNMPLNKLFIELPGICTENCKFCNEPMINGCYSCTKPINSKFDKQFYFRIISEIASYGFRNIYFHGGNVFLQSEMLKEMLSYTRRLVGNDINIFVICNSKHILNDMIDFFEKSNILLIINVDCYKKNLEDVLQEIREVVLPLDSILGLINIKIFVNELQYFSEIEKLLFDQYAINKILFSLRYQEGENKLEYFSTMPKIISDKVAFRRLEKIHSCLGGTLAISSDKKVYPCPGIKDAIGIIDYDLNKTFSHIFNNREEIMKFWCFSIEEIEPCKECEYRKTCSDCRAFDYSLGNIRTKTICNRQ